MAQVLVVDDSKNIRRSIEIALSSYGIEAVGAEDGVEALSILANSPDIELIFLDIEMPNMDGYEFLKKFIYEKNRRGLKVCFISGKNQREDIVKAIGLGGDDYLVKPIEEELLLTKVRSLIGEGDLPRVKYASLSLSLRINLTESRIVPDMVMTKLSESQFVVRSSAAFAAGETFEFVVPHLQGLSSDFGTVHGRVKDCYRKRFGLYLTQFDFVGLSDSDASVVRSITLKGEFVTDL